MTAFVGRMGHLVRRWRSSLGRSPIDPVDLDLVRSTLLPKELELWSSMALADRRHSIHVARRFVEFVPQAEPAEIAAALLHDIGKSVRPLSTSARVVATLLAPVVRRRRWDEYYRHEEIGLELCRRLPCRDRTLSLLSDADDPLAWALRRADDV